MPLDPIFKRTEPSQALVLVNQPFDAETVYVDNLVSVIFDREIAKLGFIESLPASDGNAQSRFVLNIAVTRRGLKKIVEKLTDAVSRAEEAEAQGGTRE